MHSFTFVFAASGVGTFTAPLAPRSVSDVLELEYHAWRHVHILEHCLDVTPCGAAARPHCDCPFVSELTHEEVSTPEERIPDGLEMVGDTEREHLHILDLLSRHVAHVEGACSGRGVVQRMGRRADDVLTTPDVITSYSEGHDSGLRVVVRHELVLNGLIDE